MKYVIIIGDGMADNPVPELGGKTPLEAAAIPAMDELAAGGELGSACMVPVGMAPGSDTAVLSIFGYDPLAFFSGRSPLEAAGGGITLRDGDVSYRCNMVALQDGKAPFGKRSILSHNGGSIDGESAIALMQDLQKDLLFATLVKKWRFDFHLSPGFRHVAVQHGADITGLVTSPPHDHLGEPAGVYLPHGSTLAGEIRRMMERSFEVLNPHPINQKRRADGKLPANCIWFWAQGRAVCLPAFEATHHKKGAVISAVPLVHGIGALAGLQVIEVAGATGELDTNYEGKADAALAALKKGCDFVVVHVEAPDECTHGGDTAGKVQAIEWLDRRCISRLVRGLRGMDIPWRMEVLSDHKTLTATRGHDGGAVPYLIYDSRGGVGSGFAYTEANASCGPCVADGHTLITHLFEEV